MDGTDSSGQRGRSVDAAADGGTTDGGVKTVPDTARQRADPDGSNAESEDERVQSGTADQSEETDSAASEQPTGAVELQLQNQRDTDRWTGLVGIAMLTGGIGLVASIPSLLLASALCVGVLAFANVSNHPSPTIAISREFDTADPDIGEEVTVTLEIENLGDGTLPDLRVIDLVPDGLAVVDGTPRTAVTLRPGDSATVSYTLATRRGCHEFGGAIVITRGFAGTVESEYHADAPDQLVVPPRFDPVQTVTLRSLTTPYAGRVTTDEAGEGIEFHTLREYRPGDPLRRIDWNRLAGSGDLATLEFRTERAASVVLIGDLRSEAYVRPDSETQSAADRGVDAICRLFPAFLDHGDRVGIGTIGPDHRWLAPGSGDDHRARARELLASEPTFSPASPDEDLPAGLHARRIRRQLSGSDQIVVCSPLCDDGIERAIRMLDAHGHQATVISPDPTATDTAGRKLARTERFLRIARLRRAGVRVIDWSDGESLDTAVARAGERWSG